MGRSVLGWCFIYFGMLWLGAFPVQGMEAPPAPRFTHYTVDTSKPTAEACLVFNRPLQNQNPKQYADYLKIIPETKPALRVEDRKLCLSGLAFAKPYEVIILKGVPGADGGRSLEEARLTIDMGDRQAKVAFTGNGAFILPRRVATTIGVESVNIEEAWITIHRLGERMMVPDLRSLVHLSDNQVDIYDLQKLIRQHTVPVWSGFMKIKKEHNQRVFTTFPFSENVKAKKPGIYLITMQDGRRSKRISATPTSQESNGEDDYDYDEFNEAATQWVVETDIGLSLVQGKDGLHLFARSLETGKPMANVSLALMAVNNEELGRVTTDANGGAHFDPGLMRGKRGLAPSVVMATGKDNDFTLLDLKRPAFDLSDRGVAGRPHPGEADAFLYTDRGIYRPGEAVYLTALARDPAVMSLADQPLTLVTRRPNGSEFRRGITQVTGEGAHLMVLNLPATAARGLWHVTALLPGNDQAVGQISFDVQDFIPQRLKVLASLPEPPLQPNKAVVLDVDGAFLYGAPASGLKGEAELQVKVDPTPFLPFKEYRFGRHDEAAPAVNIPLTMAETDAKGHTQATGELKLTKEFTKPLKAVVTVGLVEPGGRVTNIALEKAILAQRALVGIRPLFKNGQVREQESAKFQVAVVSPTGETVNRDKVGYLLYEEIRNHHWFYQDNRWRVQTIREDRLLEEGTVNVAANKPGEISASLGWGSYRLEINDPQGGGEGSYGFHVGWGGGENANIPDKAEVLSDKEHYRPGEKARVHILPPSPGPIQVVVATDRVWSTQTLESDKDGVTLEIPVDEQWGAGAYVLVTTYRPLNKGKARDPVRAMGVVWLGVDPQGHALEVTMETPEVLRPSQRVEIPVRVTGNAGEKVYLTLAAVDEGILQLTRFKSPDPLGHFMGKRRLAVEVRDDYGRLLDGGQGLLGETRSGGDSLGGTGLPVVPVTSVALFSGLLQADADGLVHVTLDLPDFNGKLRLMAVAHSRSRVGSREGMITVRHPLVGEVSLPRFLAPGDQGRLTLLVQNMDAPSGQVTMQLSTEGGVSLPDGFRKSLTMAPQDRIIETIPLLASPESGIGKVVLELTGPEGFNIQRSWPIAIRSPHTPVTVEETAAQKTNEAWVLPKDKVQPFEKEGLRVAVNYGLRKDLDVPGMLSSLALYPFGCTEQLTGRALALLYHGDTALLAAVGVKIDGKAHDVTQEILNQILERQDADGSIGLYRAGDGGVGHYLAGYVVDMLRLAAEKGFFVPESSLKSAYAWLRELSSRYVNDYYSGERSTYMLYALSRTGEVNGGELRYLHDNRLAKLATPLDQAALGAALYQTGDMARADSAFNQAVVSMKNRQQTTSYYASPLQEWGAILALALESHQDKVAAAALDGVARTIKPASELNTQEAAWLLRAASLMVAGDPLNITLDGQPGGLVGKGSLTFMMTGEEEGRFVNQGKKNVWRTLSITGTPRQTPPPAANGVTVARKLFTLAGQPVDPATIRQNDRFIVSLAGSVAEKSHRQMVMTDLLPAGWEIEGVVSADYEGESVYPFLPRLTHMAGRELRDDRFVAAFNVNDGYGEDTQDSEEEKKKERTPNQIPLKANAFHLAYIVRAVTPGRFFVPAPSVADMYRPTVFARGDSGVTVITP